MCPDKRKHLNQQQNRSLAMAGNRTRVNCLEGSYAHHYTTIAWWDIFADCKILTTDRLYSNGTRHTALYCNPNYLLPWGPKRGGRAGLGHHLHRLYPVLEPRGDTRRWTRQSVAEAWTWRPQINIPVFSILKSDFFPVLPTVANRSILKYMTLKWKYLLLS